MKRFTLRLDEITFKKLQKITEQEDRSINDQIISLAQACVCEFEAKHREIPSIKSTRKASP